MTPAHTPQDSWEVRTHASPGDIDPAAWNALLAQNSQPTPFMRHEWLSALHKTACASPDTGWTLLMLTVHRSAHTSTNSDANELFGACVVYVKTHSYGEYVFDWAWANAYQNAGLTYYPKLLCASPFTPVPGSRLLALNPGARAALLQAMSTLAQKMGGSSAHLLFGDADDLAAAQAAGWLIRHGVQFHWHNRHSHNRHTPPDTLHGTPLGSAHQATPTSKLPYVDMADYLAALHRDKRKKIQQERRRVADAGVSVRAVWGKDISQADWDFFYSCYRRTYLEHGNQPYLSPAFFQQVSQTLAEHWLMFVAESAGQPVAASLLGIDMQRKVAWGRYWGAQEHINCLHFELCYYAPLQWCIEQGFERFEGGAQGEHKMARGLMPSPTWSAHWLRDERFAHAVADFLAREGAHIDAYVDELRDRQVFKADQSATRAS